MYKINVSRVDKIVVRDPHIVELIWLKDRLGPISVGCTVEFDASVDR